MTKLLLSALVLTLSSQVHAEALKLDKKASSVAWTGTKKIGSSHHGTVGVKEGKIDVNDKGEVTGGTVVVDMASLANEDLKESPDNQKKLVGHLSSADFFNVSKYPTATFKLKSVTKKSDNEYTVKGDFTMIGKTNPIEFPATIKTSKDAVDGQAKVKINRTKWGLKYNSGNFFKDLAGDKIINDEFELNIKLAAKK